jgi:hypothetical protein
MNGSGGYDHIETSPPPGKVGFMGRLCDVIFGIGASVFAIIAGILVWGVLFGRADGERFFINVVLTAAFLWPILLIVIIAGPIAWWYQRTVRRRLFVFGVQVLGTIGAIGLPWILH